MNTQKPYIGTVASGVEQPTGSEETALRIKESALGAFLVIASIISGWAFKRLLSADLFLLLTWPPTPSAYYLLAPLGCTVLFCLFVFLVKDFRIRAATLFLSTVSFHVLFPFQAYFIGSIIIGWGFLMLADQETKTELASSTKLTIRKAIGRNLGYFFTGVALIMSFLYYSTIPPDADAVALLIPRPLFEGIVLSLQGPLQSIVPGIQAHASIDDFILNSIKAALKESGQTIPDALLAEEIQKQRAAYAKNSGMALTGKEEVVDVLYITARKWASEQAGPYARYIPAALAAGYFVTLKALSIVYYIAAMFLTYGTVQFFLFIGLFKKYSVAVEKEVITL